MKHAYLDQYSDRPSPIKRLDPRLKTLIFTIFIIFVILTRPNSFFVFSLYGTFVAVLILLSRVPIVFIFKRSLAVIPFVLMVGMFNLVSGREGLVLFANIFIKSYLSMLCLILLVTTTKFSELLRTFERLGCPKIITMIMSFMYRYIFVIEDELMKMRQAKESRSVGGSRFFHAKALANMLGTLFIRSYERAEAVYLAMCARGFNGNVKND
ncbi:MAG: cobalt ECF transporter T component CbiQ [Candidatus Omnitrophota bacterium]|nr:cobalt ECF transporter T component CbiQ [Candidatus Omnitrophota bacterium]